MKLMRTICLFGCLTTWTAFASPMATSPDPEPPPWLCGKAATMAGRLLADDFDPAAARFLEIMPDTNVQHYDLDIEITNVNPGANSCTITGTNVMTIQSKVVGLTEFTFRLRSQFTITSALINGTTPVSVTTQSTTTRVATGEVRTRRTEPVDHERFHRARPERAEEGYDFEFPPPRPGRDPFAHRQPRVSRRSPPANGAPPVATFSDPLGVDSEPA